MSVPIIDLHSHVLPGVDDGAPDVDASIAALRALEAQGVERVMATPHFRASLLERPGRADARLELFEDAHAELSRAVAATDLTITVGQACEFKLDAPVSDLPDGRLRLDGTRYALVEFGSFQLPPFAGNQLRAVRAAGWMPLLAHPERYLGVDSALDRVGRWVAEGTLLQVNARSLSGGYGSIARQVAVELLCRGWVCCVASDYHARGEPEWPAAIELLRSARPIDESPGERDAGGELEGGLERWVRDLVYENPGRLLADASPNPLSPRRIDLGSRGSGWRRWAG